MTLLEKIIGYATIGETNPAGMCLERIEVGNDIMRMLSTELCQLTGVNLGTTPTRIDYKGVRIILESNTGSCRVDAVWVHRYLTAPGSPLSVPGVTGDGK